MTKNWLVLADDNVFIESAKVDISRVCKCVLFSSVRETPVMTAIKIIKEGLFLKEEVNNFQVRSAIKRYCLDNIRKTIGLLLFSILHN